MRFSVISRPQTGQGPSLARSIFTPLSLSSSCTVSVVNFAMSLMNDGPRVLALLDQPEPVLPLAGQLGRGELVLAEQPDHLYALVGGHERAALPLDVGDVDQPLDDRGARGRRADAVVLHRLAQLEVVDVLAGRLHRGRGATRR